MVRKNIIKQQVPNEGMHQEKVEILSVLQGGELNDAKSNENQPENLEKNLSHIIKIINRQVVECENFWHFFLVHDPVRKLIIAENPRIAHFVEKHADDLWRVVNIEKSHIGQHFEEHNS